MFKKLSMMQLSMLALLASHAAASDSESDPLSTWDKTQNCHRMTTEQNCKTATNHSARPNNCIWVDEPEAQGPCRTQTEMTPTNLATYTEGRSACLKAEDQETCQATDDIFNCEWENNTRNCTYDAQSPADCQGLEKSDCADVFDCTWTTPEGEDEPTCIYEPSFDITAYATPILAGIGTVFVGGLMYCFWDKIKKCCCCGSTPAQTDPANVSVPVYDPRYDDPRIASQLHGPRNQGGDIENGDQSDSESSSDEDESVAPNLFEKVGAAAAYPFKAAAYPFQAVYNAAHKALYGSDDTSDDEDTSDSETSGDESSDSESRRRN